MTFKEMEACAADTLSFFMRTMPDIPFAEDDIVIEFAPRKKMVERAKALTALYRPEKTINETQAWELENIIAANAIIGRERSAVIARTDSRKTRQEWREVLYHEFMHIYCAKIEMDGEHFIDIYGSGHTPEENPADTNYDGCLNAGYVVWSEFIAQYYALVKAGPRRFTSASVNMKTIADCLRDIHGGTHPRECKTSFSMACSYLLACSDTARILSRIAEPGFIWKDSAAYGPETRTAFHNCAALLYEHLQNEKPWKITEAFISDLGMKFLWFKSMNSVYFGAVQGGFRIAGQN